MQRYNLLGLVVVIRGRDFSKQAPMEWRETEISAHRTALGQQILVAWLRNALAGFLATLVLLSLLILIP
jgi:hypothetical protein